MENNLGELAETANKIAVLSKKLSDSLIEKVIALTQESHVDSTFIFGVTIFVLACFVGYYVVWKVTPALHTPLMSVTNAISGVIIIGAISAINTTSTISIVISFIAICLSSINIFGGFIVTQRMLNMFKKK